MTTKGRVTHILEASLYVLDLDISRKFYSEIFYFDEMLRDNRMCALGVPGRQVLLLFRIDGSTVPSSTPYGNIPEHNAIGRQHMCFAIRTEDVAFWERRLDQYAIAIESKLKWPKGAVSIYFRDPDGHSIELSTPRLWPNY
jgi:catechol 2,3-dioxygenase-like lactoylglutathione lyase family enzyme